jgi:hypothetical protein
VSKAACGHHLSCKLSIQSVDIYYSYERQPQVRFWADGHAKDKGDYWEGRCPTYYDDEPLFAFANVTYGLEHEPLAKKLADQRELLVTSTYCTALPEALRTVGVKPTEKLQRLIDDFRRGLHDWTGDLSNARRWEIQTRKLSDPRWVGPHGGQLVVEVFSPAEDMQLGVKINRRFRGQNNGDFHYFAFQRLPKKGWNTVRMLPGDFQNIYGEKLDDWHKVIMLTFTDAKSLAANQKSVLPRAAGTAGMTFTWPECSSNALKPTNIFRPGLIRAKSSPAATTK